MPIPFDPESIGALAAILTETGLTEMARGRRTCASAWCARPAAPPMPAAPRPRRQRRRSAPGRGSPAMRAIPAPCPARWSASPICRPSPAPAVRHAGQAVTAGQTVLLIEAMKTFNQIKAPKAGTVRRSWSTNGQPVEYGEPLLVVE